MGPGGVFPAEMPQRGPALTDALDDNTVERLVRGRVSPDDAPPGYAGVARLLQVAAGPAGPGELAGREAGLAMFRAYGPSSGARARPRDRGRGRLVALALAGVVAGGLWTAVGAPSPPGLPSRTGAPQSGGAGSGAPGLVTQARPVAPPVAGANPRAAVQPPARERSTGNGGGPTAGRASGPGPRERRPGKPPKPKPKPEKARPKAKPGHQR